MAIVYCRPCSISAVKRAPNQASHLTFYGDGTATLTCPRHTALALNAAGTFAFNVDLGSIITPEQCSPTDLRQAIMIGHVARTGERPIALIEDDDDRSASSTGAGAG